jgi:hypothetical protein
MKNYQKFGERVAAILRGISTDDDAGQATLEAIYRAAEECDVDLSSGGTED